MSEKNQQETESHKVVSYRLNDVKKSIQV